MESQDAEYLELKWKENFSNILQKAQDEIRGLLVKKSEDTEFGAIMGEFFDSHKNIVDEHMKIKKFIGYINHLWSQKKKIKDKKRIRVPASTEDKQWSNRNEFVSFLTLKLIFCQRSRGISIFSEEVNQ